MSESLTEKYPPDSVFEWLSNTFVILFTSAFIIMFLVAALNIRTGCACGGTKEGLGLLAGLKIPAEEWYGNKITNINFPKITSFGGKLGTEHNFSLDERVTYSAMFLGEDVASKLFLASNSNAKTWQCHYYELCKNAKE
jgi:hypothetical protein